MLSGPICVLLSIVVSTLLPIPASPYFPWIALLGLALSWRFALRGLGITLLLTALFIAFRATPSIWELGIYTSLVAAWTAIALAVEEAPSIRFAPEIAPAPEATEPPPSPVPEVIAPPPVPVKELELIAKQQDELRAQQSLLERLRKELLTQCDLVSEVQREVTIQRQEAQKYKGLHNQLREQFHAKSASLDEARHKLFLVEEEHTRLLNEQREGEFSVKTPWLRDLEQLLEHSEELYDGELSRLRNENQALEELVEMLTKQFGVR